MSGGSDWIQLTRALPVRVRPRKKRSAKRCIAIIKARKPSTFSIQCQFKDSPFFHLWVTIHRTWIKDAIGVVDAFN